MTRQNLIILAAGGSLALMIGALAFQHLGGLAPCKLCIWQRYPHVVAIVIGALALAIRSRLLPWLGALAALATAGVGLYHTGVEQGWWQGPSTCTSQTGSGLSDEDFFNQIVNAPVIRCDEIPWAFAGLSMASWNMIISLALMALWVMAARKTVS